VCHLEIVASYSTTNAEVFREVEYSRTMVTHHNYITLCSHQVRPLGAFAVDSTIDIIPVVHQPQTLS
jgi:hypothetical protein